MEARIRYVKPGALRVPPERNDGADPMKLQDQFNDAGFLTTRRYLQGAISLWKTI